MFSRSAHTVTSAATSAWSRRSAVSPAAASSTPFSSLKSAMRRRAMSHRIRFRWRLTDPRTVSGRDENAAGEPSVDVVVASAAESTPPQLRLDVGDGAPPRPVLAQEPRADRALEGSDRRIEIAVFDDDPLLRHASQLGQHVTPFRRIHQMEKSDAEDGLDAVRAQGEAARVRPQKREPRPLRPKLAPGYRQHGGRDIGRDDAERSL